MDRNRVTITLKNEIIKYLDEYIDGAKIRNRSHAIEYVLTKHFSPKIKKAVILAGGKGLKMRPFTYEMPKAMIPINNRPVLEYIIENLRRHDIRELLISVGYLGKKIKQYFGDGSKFGVKIKYIDQGKLETGTGAPIYQAKKFVGNEAFVLYYSDVLASIDFTDMIDFHMANSNIATMALTSTKEPSNWGVVRLQGNKVYSFLEKPNKRKDLSNLINAGIYIFEPKIFEYLNEGTKKLEKDVLISLVKKNKLNGYVFAGHWFDIGSPKFYKEAIKKWK